jgi:hypothetical protein
MQGSLAVEGSNVDAGKETHVEANEHANVDSENNRVRRTQGKLESSKRSKFRLLIE